MSKTARANRKVSDADIIRMNSVGLSLATIASTLAVHPTTISIRLRNLGIPPADTRRTFMEDVFMSLPLEQQDWLADYLEAKGTDVKTLVRSLLQREYNATAKRSQWESKK